MSRTLTITRPKNFLYSLRKWMVKLDGFQVAQLNNGETQSIQIDEHPHQMEVVMLSAFGSPTLGMKPGTAFIMAGGTNCQVTLSPGLGLAAGHIKVAYSYDSPSITEADFVDAVTRHMVNIFNGDAILKYLNDPNNRRKDLRAVCGKDGVHIRWEVEEATLGKNMSTGYDEKIIAYEAAGVTMPKDQLTKELLDKLENSIKNGILGQTPFVKNQYGCFALGTDEL